jgi:hypothetical protein
VARKFLISPCARGPTGRNGYLLMNTINRAFFHLQPLTLMSC